MRLQIWAGMFLLGLVFLSLSSGFAQADEKMELEKLKGEWKLTSLSLAGKDLPIAEGKGPSKMVIQGNKLTELTSATFRIKLNVDKTPKWIDLETEKDGKNLQVKGIYELTKDEIRLCMPLNPQGERPTSFDDKEKPYLLMKAKKSK